MSCIVRSASRVHYNFLARAYASGAASHTINSVPSLDLPVHANTPVDINPKRPGTIMDVFSSSDAADEAPLSARFARLKRDICKDPDAMVRGWRRTLKELRQVSEDIAEKGGEMIPIVNFEDICKGLKDEQVEAVKKAGVVVVRGAIPENVS